MLDRKALLAALAVVVLTLPSTAAQAQTRTGDTELGFSFSFDDLDDDPTLFASMRLGHYVTQQFELGLELRSSGELDDVTEDLRAELFALYDFSADGGDTWYGRAGYFALLDRLGDGLLTVALGYRTYLRDDTALYWETSYALAALGAGRDGSLRSTTGLVCTF